jgi:hypothetical protein
MSIARQRLKDHPEQELGISGIVYALRDADIIEDVPGNRFIRHKLDTIRAEIYLSNFLAAHDACLLDEAAERLVKAAWARGFEGDGEWMRAAVRGKGE